MLFDAGEVGPLEILWGEPRGRHVVAIVADDVPQIDEVIHVLDEALSVAVEGDPQLAVAGDRVQPDADGDGALVAHRSADAVRHLAAEASLILERAAVLVRPSVVERDQELLGQPGAVARVDGDDVESGLTGSQCRGDVLRLDLPDVVDVHVAATPAELERARHLRSAASGETALQTSRIGTAVEQFDGRQRPLLVQQFTHLREVLDVPVVP